MPSTPNDQSNQIHTAGAAFDVWWHEEGSGMPPLPGEDTETHVRRICKIAWLNGAYKANNQSEQSAIINSTNCDNFGKYLERPMPCPECAAPCPLAAKDKSEKLWCAMCGTWGNHTSGSCPELTIKA